LNQHGEGLSEDCDSVLEFPGAHGKWILVRGKRISKP